MLASLIQKKKRKDIKLIYRRNNLCLKMGLPDRELGLEPNGGLPKYLLACCLSCCLEGSVSIIPVSKVKSQKTWLKMQRYGRRLYN
jgi:hypothetical protein